MKQTSRESAICAKTKTKRVVNVHVSRSFDVLLRAEKIALCLFRRTIQSDGTYLTLRHAFGVEGCIRDNVAFVTVPDPDADGGGLVLGYLVHPVGQQVCRASVTACNRVPRTYPCIRN